MLLHESNPRSALSSPILRLCQIPHSNNRAEYKPRIINTTWSLLLKAVSPGWMEAETTAVGWQHPQQCPPPCQHPQGDEAMVAQGQQCILTSTCLGLWHKILKFTSCLLLPPPLLAAATRAWAALPGSSSSPSPSPKLTVSTVSHGIHQCSAPPDSQKHSPPSKAQE